VFEHGLHGNEPLDGLWPWAHSVQHRTAWEPRLGPVQFALLEPGGVSAAIRLRPLRPTRLSMHPLPERGICRPGTARWLLARRRLSAPWMLTPRTPSFHVGAGRAFTETIRPLTPSVAPRHRCVGSCSDPPAAAPRTSLAHRVGFYRESQNRPTVPSS